MARFCVVFSLDTRRWSDVLMAMPNVPSNARTYASNDALETLDAECDARGGRTGRRFVYVARRVQLK